MTEPRTRSWMPSIPAPLQRLFDHFPLTVYSANELPARSPSPTSLPTLYVFSSADDAAHGRPSFNPSCLKWQTFLLLSRIPHRIRPSTNHASPTGSLPFLLPPTSTPTTFPPRPIPSSHLERYASSNTPLPPPSSSAPETTPPKQEPYLSLLTSSIRPAWLATLYLDPTNTPLLESLYILPASTSPLVRSALRHQLRSAAEAEVVKILSPTTGGGSRGWTLSLGSFELGPGARRVAAIHPEEIYAEATKAFGALASLLAESGTGWFFGADRPGLFDAAVFAYTYLAIDRGSTSSGGEGLSWGDDGRLDKMVCAAGKGELVRHRRRIWELCWGEKGE